MEKHMNSSELTVLLFATGLPVSGYDYSPHTLEEREAMLAQMVARPGIAITEGPSVRYVEAAAEGTIWIVTEPGHFAHPSLLKRALISENGARAIRVTGFTAADPGLMSQWIAMFRTQDEHMRGSALC
jgi:hypothetical protein